MEGAQLSWSPLTIVECRIPDYALDEVKKRQRLQIERSGQGLDLMPHLTGLFPKVWMVIVS